MKRKKNGPSLFSDEAPAGMDDEGPYAYARSTDPSTSHAAAASLEPETITALRARVLLELRRRGPMDDTQLVAAIQPEGYSPSGIRTRRSELVDQGHVVDSGVRQKLLSGRFAIVWQVRGLTAPPTVLH